jgi:ABC-2 type transport system ATP-binding protein
MISVQNVTKYYGNLCAVDKLSIEIPEGQILGLLGPNGAGKSTTLRILTGFIPPSEGTVFINGLDVHSCTIETKSLLGYLPESSPIYQNMIVYDYLDYISQVRFIPKTKRIERLKDLALLCGIDNVMHKSISSLSKGYKQRVGLALAMMGDPKILILDEPTSGLDPNQIIEIRSIIKEIGKERTVIFSTHILQEAEATCDRIVILNRGQIVADGSVSDLRSSNVEAHKVLLTIKGSDKNAAESTLSRINGMQRVECTENKGVLDFVLTASNDLREEIYKEIKKTEWTLLELHHEKRSLEHIFKTLTSEVVS